MAAEKLLTEASCKTAKPKQDMYYLNDGGGLRLRVKPNGSRSWIYRFRLDGKENTNSLGTYPQVNLQIARTKLAEAKQHVAKGDNPSTAIRIAKANQIIKGAIALDQVLQVLRLQARRSETDEARRALAEATELGYKVGVRVNVDVLNAQSQLYDTRRDLSKARYDVVLATLKLKLAAGVLSVQDLETVNRLTQP